MTRKLSDIEIYLELLNIELDLVGCLAEISSYSKASGLGICETAGELIDRARDLRRRYPQENYQVVEAVYSTICSVEEKLRNIPTL